MQEDNYLQLVNDLIKDKYLATPNIISAFKKIRRDAFVRAKDKDSAHVNAPLSIGHNQTISQPLTVAFMIELLQPKDGDKILDVGSGSGWTTALLAELIGEQGKVFGIERVAELKTFGEENTAKYNFIKKGIAKFYASDGHQGLPQEAPFDKILVSAAATEVPKNLIDQLRIGGRIVIPVGQWYGSQDMVVLEKIEDHKYIEERYPGFVFVPLVKE